jgi:hypothetical protein
METIMTDAPLTVRIELRDQYGKQVAHPVCETAKTFAAIAGTSTLTDVTLMRINSLGYNIITTQKEWKRP